MWLNIDELLEVMWDKLNLVRMHVALVDTLLLAHLVADIPNPGVKPPTTLLRLSYEEDDVRSRISVMPYTRRL